MYNNYQEHFHEHGTRSKNPNLLKGVDVHGRVILKKKNDADRLEEYKKSRSREYGSRLVR